MPLTQANFRRQMIISIASAGVVIVMVFFLWLTQISSNRATALRANKLEAKYDSAMAIAQNTKALVETTATIAVDLRKLSKQQTAGVEKILTKMGERSRATSSLFRREMRAVHTELDSVQSALPAPKKKGR